MKSRSTKASKVRNTAFGGPSQAECAPAPGAQGLRAPKGPHSSSAHHYACIDTICETLMHPVQENGMPVMHAFIL